MLITKELVEYVAELSRIKLDEQSIAKMEKELGDVLFAAINVGRKAGCDAEKALKESTERFAKRFVLAEQKALADGKTVTELSEAEWDKYYLAAKAELKKK